ncbi:response regulator [Spirosoma aerophilum]
MSDNDTSYKGFDGERKAFERSLALYKGRVYETFYQGEADSNSVAGTPDLPKPVILVVEDNPDEWFLIRWTLLQLFPAIQPVWLSEAREVIPYLDSCRQRKMDMPRLILVDLYLPVAQVGLSVIQDLKSNPAYQRIPAITLSRSNHADDVVSAFTCCANSYIVKPTTYAEWRQGFNMLRSYWNESVGS